MCLRDRIYSEISDRLTTDKTAVTLTVDDTDMDVKLSLIHIFGLNTWAASYEEESMQNKGFIHINAAYLAGLNCGTVIGSLIWENFGVAAVYFVAAAGAVVIILFSLWMIGKIAVVPEETDDGEGGKLKDLLDVYKRQAKMQAKLSIQSSSTFMWHLLHLPVGFFSQRFAGDIAARQQSNHAVAPVSYTHLDVYKRQAYRCFTEKEQFTGCKRYLFTARF